MRAVIDPHRPLAAEGQRLLLGYLDATAEGLLLTRTEPARGRHEARKAIKKARALIKLLREADTDFYRSENARLRDLARSLSTARDAAAMVEAAERLIAEGDGPAKALDALRAALVARRDALHEEDGAGGLEAGLGICGEARRAVEGWRLPEEPRGAAATIARGIKRNRKALRKAARAARRGSDEDFHELRKAMKADWTHRGLLREVLPGRERKQRSAVKAASERLGELNDLATLEALLAAEEIALANKQSSKLTKYIAAKKSALRKYCLAETKRLYPKGSAKPFRKLKAAFRPTQDTEPGQLTGPGEGLASAA